MILERSRRWLTESSSCTPATMSKRECRGNCRRSAAPLYPRPAALRSDGPGKVAGNERRSPRFLARFRIRDGSGRVAPLLSGARVSSPNALRSPPAFVVGPGANRGVLACGTPKPKASFRRDATRLAAGREPRSPFPVGRDLYPWVARSTVAGGRWGHLVRRRGPEHLELLAKRLRQVDIGARRSSAR